MKRERGRRGRERRRRRELTASRKYISRSWAIASLITVTVTIPMKEVAWITSWVKELSWKAGRGDGALEDL